MRAGQAHSVGRGSALIGISSQWPRVAGVSLMVRAILSLAVAIGAVVAMASLAGTLTDVVGGFVALAALLVFIHTIMELAGEPGERRPR